MVYCSDLTTNKIINQFESQLNSNKTNINNFRSHSNIRKKDLCFIAVYKLYCEQRLQIRIKTISCIFPDLVFSGESVNCRDWIKDFVYHALYKGVWNVKVQCHKYVNILIHNRKLIYLILKKNSVYETLLKSIPGTNQY